MVRESTKQGNDKVARQMEVAHRIGVKHKLTTPQLFGIWLGWENVSYVYKTHARLQELPLGRWCKGNTAKLLSMSGSQMQVQTLPAPPFRRTSSHRDAKKVLSSWGDRMRL